MRENNPIDELFREVILPYELAPSDQVWSSLDKKLQKKTSPSKPSKINKTFLTGFIILGFCALLVGYNYFPTKNNQVNAIIIPGVDPSYNQPLVKATTNASKKNEALSPLVKNANVPDSKANPNGILSGKTTSVENVQVMSNETNNTNSNQSLYTDRFEKLDPKPFVANEKKETSDKAILMMPYFSSDSKQNNLNQGDNNQAIVKNESIDALNKPEKTENTIYVPNAFTPNGDGLNDVFTPQTVENIKEYKLFIYDRNGNLIFYSDDVHKGWDGRCQNNGIETTKEDVYMWRIEIKNIKGEKEHLMGYVNLLK